MSTKSLMMKKSIYSQQLQLQLQQFVIIMRTQFTKFGITYMKLLGSNL
ncbi:unnamed protein product [Paramecium sonneborni]|uniref:Uncharacterized protein n=1 Tax=Paramecium sonneborni TaxID=65129 RepID=A0A8S1N2D2_9CILI|nr:unnamed protein product [Paramecium sonneborni]